ncbi:MAG: class I SAM-dependent methyltransferase, partial [Candidatus Nealsonbacteria bacterium]|nr:class I SAM-dependent methyltransferase [Candidatus Nealsonbacteria bacterium]
IGPGSLPKFPIQGTYFLDTSAAAIEKLEQQGGKGVVLSAEQPFPFADGFFDLVGAFEVFEHLENPEKALQQVARVLKTDGRFIFSIPIHQKYWTSWDKLAGHVQRFEPKKLMLLLSQQGFEVECCYTLRLMSKYIPISFLQYISKIGCAIISRFPQILCYCRDIGLYPYLWILKIIGRPQYHTSLNDVPSNGSSLLTICRKV